MTAVIEIAGGPAPHATVKRKLGRVNLGLYCDECLEFVALAVLARKTRVGEIEVRLSGDAFVDCPFCRRYQRVQPERLVQLFLDGKNLRKPRPASAHLH